MKVLVEARGQYILDVDPTQFETVDEIEKSIQEVVRWSGTSVLKNLEVWLPAAERGALLEELKKNNS